MASELDEMIEARRRQDAAASDQDDRARAQSKSRLDEIERALSRQSLDSRIGWRRADDEIKTFLNAGAAHSFEVALALITCRGDGLTVGKREMAEANAGRRISIIRYEKNFSASDQKAAIDYLKSLSNRLAADIIAEKERRGVSDADLKSRRAARRRVPALLIVILLAGAAAAALRYYGFV